MLTIVAMLLLGYDNSLTEAVGFVPADGEVRETHRARGSIDGTVTSSQREAFILHVGYLQPCRIIRASAGWFQYLIIDLLPPPKNNPTFKM